MVEVKNLIKKYGDVYALNNISFTLNPGEICGYIGTNGAGKSTTVKIITGMLNYDSGKVYINGMDVTKDTLEVKKIIGYVPENANLFASLTPIEYLNFIGKIYNIPSEIILRRITNFSELFEYNQFLKMPIGNLSKGNKQKVLITSALLHDPEIIYLDEPLNGLDANSIYIFQDLILYLSSRNKVILYCSHLLDVIEKISTRIIIIDKGNIVMDKSTNELKKSQDFISLENLFRTLKKDSETKKISYESLYN